MDSKQKLISFCIPSYNSEPFLHIALDSLIPGGDRIEVLIIDDGSKDGTLDVAKSYEEKYPGLFKAIHQENKGHGGAINTALALANGKYFKVLDSDDWTDTDSLNAMLDFIEEHDEEADLILADYVYEQGYDNPGKRISFTNVMKPGRVLPLKKVRTFPVWENVTLHTAFYRTEIFRASGVVLPEHCSYEDNYMVYAPMTKIQSIAYVHVPFYHYLIGRDGQSMSQDVLARKYPDMLRCNQLIFDYCDVTEIKKRDKALYRLVRHHLIQNFMYAPSISTMGGSKSEEALQAVIALENHCKETNPKQWKIISHAFRYWIVSGKSRIGRAWSHLLLKAAMKVLKFVH